MLRVAGIVALFVLAACSQSSTAPTASPSVPSTSANWTQDLTFSGELTGHMTGIVPDSGSLHSACTGPKPRPGQTWADEFYGVVDSSGQVWGLDFVINNFGGPGTYQGMQVSVQVHSIDNSQLWLNQGGDSVTLSMETGQQSGTIDAMLTDASSGQAGAVHVTGAWHCRA